MKNALIRNNVVVNVITSAEPNPELYDQVIECSGLYVEPGYLWQGPEVGDGREFVQPGASPVTELQPLDFQRRFTPAEYFAAGQLAKTDATMSYVWGLFDKAPLIHLDHPDTIAGVGYMEHVAGILTAERAEEILST